MNVKKKIKNKRAMRRLLFLGMAVLCLIGAAVYTVFLKPLAEEVTVIYMETQVEFGDLVQGIMESGTLEFRTVTQDYDVAMSDDEDDEEDDDEDDDDEDSKYLKVEAVYVVPGQRIAEGDAILKVTDKSMRAVRRSLEADQAEAQLTYENAVNAYEIEEVSALNTYQQSLTDSQWSESQYAVDTAKISVEASAVADEITVLEQEIRQIEADLENEWEDYADIKEEYEKYQRRYEEWDKDNLYEYIPLRTSYMDAKDRYEEATESRLDRREEMVEKQEEIAEKQEELETLLEQTSRKELDARQTYEQAVLSGQLAEAVYTYSLESLKEEMETAQKEMEDLSETLADFDAFVGEDGVVYAKGNGLVTGVSYEAGDTLIEESAIITYVEADEYVLNIDISEEDIPYVAVGDEVSIEFTAYPEEIWKGRIQEITTTETSESTATVSYPVIVKVLGDTSALYGGMTGDVTFVTDEADQVIYVSRKAIVREDDKTYVYVADDKGGMTLKEVETGFTDGVNMQIVSGLEAGDTVYIASQVSADEEELKETENERESSELGGSQ